MDFTRSSPLACSGWGLARETTLIVTTAPARGIMVCYPAFVALAPEIRVRPEMLHVFRYIDMLTCVIYNCT